MKRFCGTFEFSHFNELLIRIEKRNFNLLSRRARWLVISEGSRFFPIDAIVTSGHRRSVRNSGDRVDDDVWVLEELALEIGAERNFC